MPGMLNALAMQTETPGAASTFTLVLIWLVVMALAIGGMWMTFQKAGQPGWAAIIPIYNVVVLMRVARKPAWWVVLVIVPIVNIVVLVIVSMEVSRNFGKGAGFGWGLALLAPIFYPILGYGDAQYQPTG